MDAPPSIAEGAAGLAAPRAQTREAADPQARATTSPESLPPPDAAKETATQAQAPETLLAAYAVCLLFPGVNSAPPWYSFPDGRPPQGSPRRWSRLESWAPYLPSRL